DQTPQAHRRDAGLRAAREHDVGFVVLDGAQGVADGVRRRGAGRRHGRVRTAQAELDRDGARRRVGDHLGDDEGRDTAGALGDVARVLLLELADAANAAAEDDATAERVLTGNLEAAVLDRFLGGHQRELSEAVQAPGRL